MKTRKNIAKLLSFLMVLSLLLGLSASPVYAIGGEGETASFEIREANGQTGTVQYKLDGSGDFISANNSTLVALNGATSITIKAIPNGDAQVNQSNSDITGTEEAVTFDYGALISESGWTYNIQDNDGNITFTIEFDNHDGTGGGSNPGDEPNPDGGGGEDRYLIDFTNAPWTVDGVEVDLEGREPDAELMAWITTEDVIPLTNFDPYTMDAVLIVDEDVTLCLNVDENGNTRLADVYGGVEVLPPSGAMIFSVVKKPVDNEEFETESFTLTDDKGNVISLTYEKNRELSFTMIDYLAFSPEDLETAGISQEFYDSAMKGIKNATKQHGTLLSFYEIQVENDDGFLIHEGPFYIKIKMTDEMKKYDIFKIVYMDVEDNFATESPITLTQEGGYLVGTLEHLSTYALVGDNAPGENDAPADSDTSAPTSPQTGDNSNLGLWVFLLVLSSCSMIALIVIDKKRKIAK